MIKNVMKPFKMLQRRKRDSSPDLVVLVEAGHGARVSVVAVGVRRVVREVLLPLVGGVRGHCLLHALMDLLRIHLTSASVDVRLQGAHPTAK